MPASAFARSVSCSGLLCAACVVGCGDACGNPFIVTDSFTPPPQGFDSAPDSLHDYAVGTQLTLLVRPARLFIDMNVVKVVSKNKEFLTVDDQTLADGIITVKLTAVAAGTAGLAFLDDKQRPLEERVIEVKQPDEIVLAVNIDTDKGYTVPVIDTDALVVAQGGNVTFRVTYKAKGREVKGSGVLVGASDVLAVANPTDEKPDREFVTFTAPNTVVDLGPVDLKVDDIVVLTVQARVSSLDEVASIQLDEGQLPTFQNNGDVFTVWAKAFTTDAVPVFGAPFDWTFDSAGIDGTGDLVSYTFEGGSRRLVQVKTGEAVEELTVEAKDGTGAVAETAVIGGCSALPSSSAAAAPFALVLALAVVLRRRRSWDRIWLKADDYSGSGSR